MPIYADVEARLDERSFDSASNTAERHFRDVGDSSSRSFMQSFSTGMRSGMGGLVSELGTGLRTGIDRELQGLGGSFDGLSSRISGVGSAGLGAVAGVAAVGAAAVVAGKQLYDMGVMWDEVTDSIAGRTGKIGDDLDSLTSSVKNVADTTASSIPEIGNIAGQVSQSLRLTGEPLEVMTKRLADLNALTGESVNVRELGQAYRLFGVDVRDQVPALDSLYNASTATGIPIGELIKTVGSAGPAMKEFGLDFGQSASLVATFEEAGLDANGAVNGLRVALKNFAADGREPQQALRDTITEIRNLANAGNDAGAVDLAAKTFGRGYAPFLDAIKSGKLDVDALNDSLSRVGPTIDDVRQKTSDWQEQFQVLKNELTTELEPAASTVFSGISVLIEQYLIRPFREANGLVSGFRDALNGVTPWQGPTGPMTLGPDGRPMAAPAPAAGANPLAALGGGLGGGAAAGPQSLDDLLRPGGAASTGAPATNGVGSGFGALAGLDQGGPSWGPSNPFGRPGGNPLDRSSQTPKLPDAPVLPIDTALPQGFAGLPQTASMMSAQSGYINAHHDLAEKQARVTQLENDNAATAADVQKARNDVIAAEQSSQQAEQRLIEARQQIFDQQTKSLEKGTADLKSVFAPLDEDFGVSGGLPGIVKNLVTLMGDFAFAGAINSNPQWQQDILAWKQQENAPDSSSATTGAYGTYPVSALGPAGLQPPTPFSATAQPGESARDFAHRVMMPYWQSQGFTVGDHAADKYGEHQNGALDIMVPNIQAGQQVLQQVLSDPNVYGAIFDNKTYGYGHGSTPRDYTAGHTGDPTQDHENHVHAWYKPGGGGGGLGGGSTSSGPVPVNVVSAPGMQQWSADWNAIAQKESGGNWNINTGNGYSGGLQFTPSSWAAAGGTQYAPSAYQASPYQQAMTAENLLGMQGPGAWPNTFTPGSSGPAPGGGAPGMPGFQSTGLASYAQAAAPGGGSGGGGGGGLLGAAASAMPIPGGQVMAQLAMRSIQFGAQAASIGVSGLMETFIPHNSQLGDPGAGWIGRIAGGLAGAKPAAKNKAAQDTPPPMPAGDQHPGSGAPPGPTNGVYIDKYIAQDGEHSAGQDLARHQTAQYEAGRGR